MNQDTHDLMQKVLRGEHSTYPGHPIVVGLLIMEVYPNVEAASRRTEHGWADALSNSAIPGAGSEVRTALAYLERMAKGSMTPQEAIERARTNWNAGGHVANVIPGQEQADRFADDYIAKATAWLNLPTTTPSAP